MVESVAFCCCQTVGLDTTANSIPYLTSWAQDVSLDVLEHAAALTARLSDRIESALIADDPVSPPMGQAGESPGAERA